MNILITGATGFVGRHLIEFLQKDHSVHILVRPSSDYSCLHIDHIFVFENNIEVLAEYLRKEKIDGIIHLASLCISSEHRSDQIKDLILSNVYLGTALLEASVKGGVKWFLNTGTIWQNYNVPPQSDEYCPVNLYAATKQAFMVIAKYYTEISAIRFCTLKLCDTYGPDDTRGKVFALFKQISETGETLDMSPGEQKLDMLYIDDVVSGFSCLVHKLHDENIALFPEYVLSSRKQYTLKQLADIFEKTTHKKLLINWGARGYRKREVMVPYEGNIVEGWFSLFDIENVIGR